MGGSRDKIAAGMFERNMPRYNTYPTPAFFHEGVGAADFDAWTAALAPGTRIRLRLQVPYCRALCWFCACRTQALRREEELDAYLAAMHAEIRRTAALLPAGVEVGALQFCGGTPTVLAPEALLRLAGWLRAELPMAGDAGFEVATDPRTLDPARLDALAAAGVTAVMLGVTDFAPRVQRASGRVQDAAETAAAVAGLRARGIGTVGVDIVHGLPLQDRASLAATLAAVLAMRPDRIVLAGYMHVPWMAKRQRMISEACLPDAETRLALRRTAADMIGAAGYLPGGADRFVRAPEAEVVMGAGLGQEPVVGIGVATISAFPQGYVQNTLRTARYHVLVGAGLGAGERGVVLGLGDRIRGRAIRMLLRDFRIDLAALRAEYGDFVRVLTPGLALAVARFGTLVERGEDALVIPHEGVILARAVARCFDAQWVSSARPEA